jgi:hypothetical protein
MHHQLLEVINLKYRLATLLLIVTVLALLAGWIKSRVDTRYALTAAEREFDRIRGGVRIEAEVRQLIDLSSFCDPEATDSSRRSKLQNQLVFGMWQLYEYEARIDLAYPGDNYATKHARKILTALKCTTAEDFFGLARDLYEDPKNWPEYFDPEDEEYIKYFDFVIRSSNAAGRVKSGKDGHL